MCDNGVAVQIGGYTRADHPSTDFSNSVIFARMRGTMPSVGVVVGTWRGPPGTGAVFGARHDIHGVIFRNVVGIDTAIATVNETQADTASFVAVWNITSDNSKIGLFL